MSLRSEVREVMEAINVPVARRVPILAVIDQWEEMEVQFVNVATPNYWRTREGSYWESERPGFIILMRRQGPDVEELARRVVKEWRGSHGSMVPICDAMDALEEELDK